MQSVDVLRYTDEEYEKHLTDPVGTSFSIVKEKPFQYLVLGVHL